MAEGGCLQHEKVWQSVCELRDACKDHEAKIFDLSMALVETQQTNKQLCETLGKIEKHLDKNADIQAKMQISLTSLTEFQQNLKSDVSDLKKVVYANEDEHKIDLRPIQKKQNTEFLLKFSAILTPLGLVAYIILSSIK